LSEAKKKHFFFERKGATRVAQLSLPFFSESILFFSALGGRSNEQSKKKWSTFRNKVGDNGRPAPQISATLLHFF